MTKSRELTKLLSDDSASTAWDKADGLVEQAYGIPLDDLLEDYERLTSRPQARIRFARGFAKQQSKLYRRSIRKSKCSNDAYVLELLQGEDWVLSAAWHLSRRRWCKNTIPCAALDRICELLHLGYDLKFAPEDICIE